MSATYTHHVHGVNMNYVHGFPDTDGMETMADRLRWARERAGVKSGRKAALDVLRISPSTYAAHENGQNDFGPEDAERYAKAFKVSPSWLLLGIGDPGRPRVTKLLGKVGAGAEVFPLGDGAEEEIDLAPGAPLQAVAVTVEGDSMYPRYYHGEKLFYVRDGTPPAELIGKECVIQLKNGGMLVKTLRKGSKPGLYNLESWNATVRSDERVEWAAAVRWTERN
jgi:phage repressor protein C with HTH and peptisase S24 domain